MEIECFVLGNERPVVLGSFWFRHPLLSGLLTAVCASCNFSNEKRVWPISPGCSVNLQRRGTRSEA